MKRFFEISFIILAAMLALVIFLNSMFWSKIALRRYSVDTGKLTAPVKIVLLSDLHSYIYGENQEILIEKIKNENPDIIALSGDIADDVVPIDGTKILLEGIKDIAPCYYVIGNHEYWSDEIEDILEIFYDNGVTVLRDEMVEIDTAGGRVIIAGINDPAWKKYSKIGKTDEQRSELFADISESKYPTVLLAHRPENTEIYEKYGFDLILSGHVHGGIVRIPGILNGLISPDTGFFPKFAGGEYSYGKTTHIISRGLVIDEKPRIFNPPEICVITLK